MAQFGDFTVDRNSTKYVLGSGGTIISYATDEPAFEFNVDGSYKGLLVEPAATNICLQSEDFGTTWLDARLDTTSWLNQETAPDGNTTADKLIQASGEIAAGNVQQNITLSAGVHTFSVFAKKGTRNWISLRTNATGSNLDAWFNTDAGTVGTVDTGLTGKIEEYPNGWYRCSITFTATAGGKVFLIYNTESDNTVIVADDGGYQYAWGAQVETGPIATSYIPTTTASVTRNKDDITLGSASSLIGQTEGTIYMEVDWGLATGITQDLLSANDGTENNRVVLTKNINNEIRMFAQANSVVLTNQGESSSGYSGIQKIAFAYKTDDFELYRNGSSISSDTSGSLAALATLTNIDLGQNYNAANQANMHIRAVALYPTRLSDAEAQALTTL
jgi:hypothetical protein